jgi:hypothetical protein
LATAAGEDSGDQNGACRDEILPLMLHACQFTGGRSSRPVVGLNAYCRPFVLAGVG